MGTRPETPNPALDKYRAARTSLEENTFINNSSRSRDDLIYLRGIQSMWKVKLHHLDSKGFVYQMMLIWDYDCIWGTFNLGAYKGVLMADHGPDHEPPSLDDSDESGDDNTDPVCFDFTWRGTCTGMPNTVLNNPLITRGKIEFGSSWISGYFEGMMGSGLPDSRCDFEGNRPWGPARVPRNLQSFIDEWNDLNVFDEEESIRLPPRIGIGASSTGPGHGRVEREEDDDEDQDDDEDNEDDWEVEEDEGEEEDDGDNGGNNDEENEGDEEVDDEGALQAVSGLYGISSKTIAGEWPDKAKSLSARLS
jgi:hypothetical protein